MIIDTSSIYKAVEMNCIEKIEGGKTLDLSLYELGNVIWKTVNRGNISISEGKKILDVLMDVISLMEIIRTGLNKEAYEIAVKNNISYYDASFLYAALSSNEAIISEDIKLLDIAKKYDIMAYRIGDLPP